MLHQKEVYRGAVGTDRKKKAPRGPPVNTSQDIMYIKRLHSPIVPFPRPSLIHMDDKDRHSVEFIDHPRLVVSRGVL